jgi:hypothetical protein
MMEREEMAVPWWPQPTAQELANWELDPKEAAKTYREARS